MTGSRGLLSLCSYLRAGPDEKIEGGAASPVLKHGVVNAGAKGLEFGHAGSAETTTRIEIPAVLKSGP